MIAITSVTAMISDVMLSQCCFQLQRSIKRLIKITCLAVFKQLKFSKNYYHFKKNIITFICHLIYVNNTSFLIFILLFFISNSRLGNFTCQLEAQVLGRQPQNENQLHWTPASLLIDIYSALATYCSRLLPCRRQKINRTKQVNFVCRNPS